MPRQVDLREHLLQLSHDPTQQLTPDVGLEKMANGLAELLLKIPEMLRDEILRVIETLLGIAANPIPALQEWVQNIPVLSQIVQAITGIPGGLAELARNFANLREFLKIDLNLPTFDPAAAAQQFATTVIQPFIRTIAKIRAALLGPLPIGLMTDSQPTLLLEGGFDDPITIVEGSGFTHDATDGVPGTTPLGCARVECDGQHHQIATEIFEVSPGWTLRVTGRVKYEDLVAGADALRINVIRFADESTPIEGGAALMVATAGTVSGTSGGPDGWGTVPIVGTWTVPDTGVTHVAVECHTADLAAEGVAKFDEITVHATQKIPQRFTKDLPEDLTSLWNWLGSLVDHMLTALGIAPVGGLLDRIFDLSDELEWIQSKAQEAGEEIQAILDAFKGGVGGAITDIKTALDAAGQNVRDGIVQALGGSGTGHTVEDVIEALRNIPRTAVNGLEDALNEAGQGIRDAICNALGFPGAGHSTADVVTALMNIPQANIAGLITLLNALTASVATAVANTSAVITNIFRGWFGRDPDTVDPQEVQYTIEAVKDAIISGYNVVSHTSHTANWPRPDCSEMVAVLIGGGQNGPAGIDGGVAGGLHGSYIVQQLDVDTLPSAFDIEVGSAGNKSRVRVANGSFTGAILAESGDHGTAGGQRTAFGFSGTASNPGNGGAGGHGTQTSSPGTNGSPGGITPAAAGGSAGQGSGSTGVNGGDGGPGGNVPIGAVTKCGGGGGGGGGGGYVSRGLGQGGTNGGAGGPGGYPGGGGGAGGGRGLNQSFGNGAHGPGGPGAAGAVWIFYR